MIKMSVVTARHDNMIHQYSHYHFPPSHVYLFIQKYKDNPPTSKNQARFIGAIVWKRLLCSYLTKSVITFQKVRKHFAIPCARRTQSTLFKSNLCFCMARLSAFANETIF